MEIPTIDSKTGAGSCGRCENCQCGQEEAGRTHPGDETADRPPQAAGSITTPPGVDVARPSFAPATGGDGR